MKHIKKVSKATIIDDIIDGINEFIDDLLKK